ncbi:hypothetical protein FB451DRAFT_1407741 [Mycena latifolia]|nr:hypothetical protein FB451DRAFT_1407741 [Mycena latifolia]
MRTISTPHVMLAIALAARAAPTPPPSPIMADEVITDEYQKPGAHATDIFVTLDKLPAPVTQSASAEDDLHALLARDSKEGFPGYCTIA